MHHKALWSLTKQANRGFRGYPMGTIAFYGPDDRRATKVAVGIVRAPGEAVTALERWFSEDTDVRNQSVIVTAIQEFIDRHHVKSLAMPDRVLGCPHEEGVDYPVGAVCPQCPFWADRDRWDGTLPT